MTDQKAKFLEGSLLKHIIVMSGTGSVGLMALFVVDLLDMLFISMLGQAELAAAVGFAGTLIFFSTSVSIGTSIAMGALVSKALGAGQRAQARQLTVSTLITAFVISALVCGLMFVFIDELLAMIGAREAVAERAKAYMMIMLPSGPILAMGMAAGAGLRAVGDAKRSMWATLAGGLVNAILDPFFIFVLNMNVEGAAIASVAARITVFLFSIVPLIRIHQLVAPFSISVWKLNIAAILAIALPAVVTNIATPIGNAIVTSSIAQFGEDYVAGFAVIGRLIPVCFAVIFALSGAVGPIVGQNFGAERFDRVRDTLYQSMMVTSVYTVLVCILLFALQDSIILMFSLTGDAALIVGAFCTYVAVSFIFNGIQFVANTSFNNLGKPLYSTALNMGKATLGTFPFVYLGAHWFGALGVLYGQALGTIVFGVIAFIVLRFHISLLMAGSDPEPENDPSVTCVNTQPFCSHDAVMIEEMSSPDEKSLNRT